MSGIEGVTYTEFMVYLLHYTPGDRCVRGVEDLPHQHWFEEGPGDGSSCGIDHVQVHVHTKWSYKWTEQRRSIRHTVFTRIQWSNIGMRYLLFFLLILRIIFEIRGYGWCY